MPVLPIALWLAAAASFDAAGGGRDTQLLWRHMAGGAATTADAVPAPATVSLGWEEDRGSAAAGVGGSPQPGSLAAGARLSLTFSKLSSSSLAAMAMLDDDAKQLGRILESLAVFQGQACNRGSVTFRLSPAQIAGALVRRKVAVYRLEDAQGAIERARRRGRGVLSRVVTAAVPVSMGGSAVASGLAATGTIRMSNGWSAGIAGGAILIGLLANAGRQRAITEAAPLSAGGRTWLSEMQDQDLAPGACVGGLYFGSQYPAPNTIAIEE